MEQGRSCSLLAPVLAPGKRVPGFGGGVVPRAGTPHGEGELSPWRPLPLASSGSAGCIGRSVRGCGGAALVTAPSHRGEGGRWSPAQHCVCFGVGTGEKVRIPRENGKLSVKTAETRLRNMVLS